MQERNAKKFGCYVMDLGHKECNMHEIKMLGLTIEEGVNSATEAAKTDGKSFGNVALT